MDDRARTAIPPTELTDQRLVARALLAVWLGGTSVYTASLFLATPATGRTGPHWAVVVVAWAMAAQLVVRRRRLTTLDVEVACYLCYVLAGTVVAAGRDSTSAYALFYLWLVALAGHLLPPRRAVWHTPFAAVSYAIALALCDGGFAWFRLVLLTTTGAVVGVSVGALRARVDTLVARLADTARTDPLTGLANRLAFDEQLELELERAARGQEPLALLVADLDHFKEVNDRLGHPAGDDVLRRAAATIASSVRRIDGVARIGGEEFAVLAPGTDAISAHLLAERVRRRLAEELGGGPVAVTASIGVAVHPLHALDGRELVAVADAACYQAKARGRDRTVTATVSPGAPPMIRRLRDAERGA